MTFSHLMMVAIGGAAGAVGRYLTVALVTNAFGSRFPWGTLAVNIIGSFCLGLAFVFIVERLHAESQLRSLLMVGFLGAFTTFSTFSLEVFNMLDNSSYIAAGAYILMSVILCVFATGLAIFFARSLLL